MGRPNHQHKHVSEGSTKPVEQAVASSARLKRQQSRANLAFRPNLLPRKLYAGALEYRPVSCLT